MRKALLVLTLATVLLFSVSAMAQTKVVVIPLNSSQRTTCTAPDEVLSQGQCWKDRNLGAGQVANSAIDGAAFGDFYQWGRLGDGHQNSTGLSWNKISLHDIPGNGNFITSVTLFYDDWRNPQNGNLWQGLGGTNNPCPQGFRVPTEEEFEIERASWSRNDIVGAFESPLKLPAAGLRLYIDGTLNSAGTQGFYWTSTTSTNNVRNSRYLYINTSSGWVSGRRGYGMSVRCIKD